MDCFEVRIVWWFALAVACDGTTLLGAVCEKVPPNCGAAETLLMNTPPGPCCYSSGCLVGGDEGSQTRGSTGHRRTPSPSSSCKAAGIAEPVASSRDQTERVTARYR